MKNILLLSLVALIFSACDPYQNDASCFIEMKKDPCFGFCPVYTFKVDGKGKATFSGERNVKKMGNWKRTLSPEEANVLFKAFSDGNFFAFKDEYTDQVTDLPTTFITFSDGTQTKTIKDYYGAPEALKNLERLVEAIAEAEEGWTNEQGDQTVPPLDTQAVQNPQNGR